MLRSLPRVLPFIAVLALALPPAHAQVVSRRIGRATVRADHAAAWPGGLLIVHLDGLRRAAATHAILDGRRCPFFPAGGRLRALVPIPATFPPGPATLGIEIRTRTGRQRVALPVLIATRAYPERTVVIPEPKRALVAQRSAVRDGRQLQKLLRTVSGVQHWHGPFKPPVAAEPAYSYGAPMSYVGASPVEATADSIHGEYHRGLDYQVPLGTAVQAPAAGIVLAAGPLGLAGETVVVDHGQGVISTLCHLSRVDVREGAWIDARAAVGLSGESGVAAEPHLHWAVYVLGVAVDPRVLVGRPLG